LKFVSIMPELTSQAYVPELGLHCGATLGGDVQQDVVSAVNCPLTTVGALSHRT
jgi:hypothetical protein